MASDTDTVVGLLEARHTLRGMATRYQAAAAFLAEVEAELAAVPDETVKAALQRMVTEALEPEFREERNILSLGTSRCFTLPLDWLRRNSVSPGDRLLVTWQGKTLTATLWPKTDGARKG
jgi:hypothetical protein